MKKLFCKLFHRKWWYGVVDLVNGIHSIRCGKCNIKWIKKINNKLL